MRKWYIVALVGLVVVCAIGAQETEPYTDAEVRANVRDVLRRDARVDAEQVEVSVDDGVVLLLGTVDSVNERIAAAEDAHSVIGVLDVRNELTVAPDLDSAYEDVLESDVRNALRTSSEVDASEITVDVDGNRAVLRGSVETEFERRRAATIAVDVFGVTSVRNELVVEPVALRTDVQIRRDIRAALRRNVLVDEEQILVDVEDGVVTLTGTVSSRNEEDEAVDIARVTAGVTSVVDELVVEPTVEVSDSTIRVRVRSQLRWDTRVDATDISVSVDGSTVTLRGSVESGAQESAAISAAWSVAGVRDVIDQIEVTPGAVAVTESPIARVVENAIRLDPDVLVRDLEVTTDDGTVTLYGQVDEAWMAPVAGDIAANLAGVQDVRNEIEVVPTTTRSDPAIRRDIAASLRADALVDASDIQVVVNEGVVTLDGTVDTWIERERAYDIALRTAGVLALETELIILP
jgi:osmotically-inducible protein OsmY